MAQESVLRNIDKIAYSVAGGLAIVILAIPLFSGGGVKSSAQELSTLTDSVGRKVEKPQIKTTADREGAARVVKRQWTVVPGKDHATWVTERAPIVVLKEVEIVKTAAVHRPAGIAELSFNRDPEKHRPFFRIRGVMNPANEAVRVSRVTLIRKEIDPEAADAKPTVKEVPGVGARGDFQFDDYDIRPGLNYCYSIVTRAVAEDASTRPLDAASAEQTSPECCAPKPVPYDFNFAIQSFSAGISAGPTVRAKVTYADYESGEVKTLRTATYKEGGNFGPDKRFLVRRITPETRSVSLRDRENPLARYEVTLRDKKTIRRSCEAMESTSCPPPAPAAPGAESGEATEPTGGDLDTDLDASPSAGGAGGESLDGGSGPEKSGKAGSSSPPSTGSSSGGRRRRRSF